MTKPALRHVVQSSVVSERASLRSPICSGEKVGSSDLRVPRDRRARNFTPRESPSQTGSGEKQSHSECETRVEGWHRASARGAARRQQCRRCRAGARRTARSRTPPPSASPTSTPTSRSAVESSRAQAFPPGFCGRQAGPGRVLARPRIYGRTPALHWEDSLLLFGVWFFFSSSFSGSGCRDREGYQPRGEPAQGTPPAQCVDSIPPMFSLSIFFWLNLVLRTSRIVERRGFSSVSRFEFAVSWVCRYRCCRDCGGDVNREATGGCRLLHPCACPASRQNQELDRKHCCTPVSDYFIRSVYSMLWWLL